MLAVLCPGQGAQHAGMLDLLLVDPFASRVLNDACDALGTHPREWLADPSRLFGNDVAQPLICAAQLAAWEGLRRQVPEPLAFAGYSVGELASYGCAGAIDAPTLARLAQRRAAVMESAAAKRPGGMIALRGLTRADVEFLCAGRSLWPAIVIDETAFVLGGTDVALEEGMREASTRGWKVTCLDVGVASHTPLLAAAVAPFRRALEATALRTMRTPVVSGIDGALRTGHEHAADTLARQLAQTVDWSRCLDTLHERGCRVFLELLPGRALSRMVRERFPDAEARALDDFRSLAGAAKWVRSRTG